ncbi:MAG: NAD(P)H-hydrate dehydratase [Clostridia bacterium]|nr:NAD(P)H-hydrate dehydratase [Clostridia bacterium]
MSEIKRFSYDTGDLSLLPKRDSDGYKGTFGRVLVIAGSVGMSGAAYFAAKAAYRSGAGLVEIFSDDTESSRVILQTLIPEALFSSDREILQKSLEKADSVVIGCGMGKSDRAVKLLTFVAENCKKPLVIDADGLNIISESPHLLDVLKKRQNDITVLTPHIGEMKRLLGRSAERIFSEKSTGEIAYEYAKNHRVICVLKESKTAVSDGSENVYINASGNCGMATGGSGDVLAGMIGSMLAQHRSTSLTAMQKVSLAVYIHGLAGDYASRRVGQRSSMASDIIESIPDVFLNLGF